MDVNVLINIGMITIAAVSILISVYTFYKSKDSESYSSFDGLYQDLLMVAVDKPRFVNTRYTENYETAFDDEDTRHSYEIYAYMAFNICETIIDMHNKTLMETWLPVIQNEYSLHKNWLKKPQNARKFKQKFHDFVAECLEK